MNKQEEEMIKAIVEQIGTLANKLTEARAKIETDERIKMVLSSAPHQHTVNTCGQGLDSHLYVKAIIGNETIELAGEQDHPSFNGRVFVFGSDELKHLSRELTVVQLSALYSSKGKKPIKVIADYTEEYEDWESGNPESWEIEFSFP